MTVSHPAVRYSLEVAGMSCAGCVAHVERALLGVDGVSRARVDLESGQAMVGGEAIDPGHLAEAVARAGYKVTSAEQAAPCHGPEPGAAA